MINSELLNQTKSLAPVLDLREMLPISKAIRTVLRESDQLRPETVDLDKALGRILAENIVADTDLPPFDRSMMDGFAVVAIETQGPPVSLKIVGESAAGHGWHKSMKRGEAVRIMTGAPVPKGSDAVQRVELTRESTGIVEVLQRVRKGEAIVKKGSEIRKGKIVFKVGERISENRIAVLASFGYARVQVFRQPRVTILATGSEIVDTRRKPGRDQIRNSNSPMLKAFVEKCGGIPEVQPVSGDDLSHLRTQIKRAARGSDILVVTGGVSVGKYDLTKAALRELRATIFFERVNLKPGKPTVFAKLGKTRVFGLPGNPVSAAVTFCLFVRSAVLRMQGYSKPELRIGYAVLDQDAKAAKDRDTYIPATLDTDRSGRLIATPLRSHGSSDFVGFARAEALIFIQAGERYKIGEVAEIRYL